MLGLAALCGLIAGAAAFDIVKGTDDTPTDGDDTLTGTDGPDLLDLLDLLDGDDMANTGAGNDTVFGGDGDDWIDGAEDDDLLAGGNDDDALLGDLGLDSLIGGAGDDYLAGQAGDDGLWGGEGDDDIIVKNWLSDGGTVVDLRDFAPHSDRLFVVYDDEAHPDPKLTLTENTDDPGTLRLQLDGLPVSDLPNTAQTEVLEITLITETEFQSLHIANAPSYLA